MERGQTGPSFGNGADGPGQGGEALPTLACPHGDLLAAMSFKRTFVGAKGRPAGGFVQVFTHQSFSVCCPGFFLCFEGCFKNNLSS